ncbi:hypothetical protein BD779DRAFT_1571823 [Infundibulicybe gibba]|nr:hypothetical protein BD779DRAFT_1571823 [Infundibulicybe gibba]
MSMNDHAFDLVIGVLALLSAVISALGYYHSRLPSQRMEKFDKIFGHSKKLFSRAREDGLITASLQWSISEMIAGLEASSLGTRNRVYAFSQGSGVYAMNRELSKEINILIRDVERLRISSRCPHNNSCSCRTVGDPGVETELNLCEKLACGGHRLSRFRISASSSMDTAKSRPEFGYIPHI